MELTFCELREKMVFNIIDGKRLGRIIDITFTLSGQILGITVPDDKKIFKCLSCSDNNLFIPWKCIRKIGEDAILVELIGDSCNLLPDNNCNSRNNN